MPLSRSKSALANLQKPWQTTRIDSLFFGVNVERIEF
jgi:hypothetical protein